MNEKLCKSCDITKELSEFYVDRGTKDGLNFYCKSCISAKRTKYRAENIDHFRKINYESLKRRRKESYGEVTLEEKKCSGCLQVKPVNEYNRNSSASHGIESKCRMCQGKYVYARHIEKTYGISIDEYNLMVEASGGRCAICQRLSVLVIDHNHTTGKVRGLLCKNCNFGIGLLGDSIDTLRSAQSYLS
jgi:hypothetical protein